MSECVYPHTLRSCRVCRYGFNGFVNPDNRCAEWRLGDMETGGMSRMHVCCHPPSWFSRVVAGWAPECNELPRLWYPAGLTRPLCNKPH